MPQPKQPSKPMRQESPTGTPFKQMTRDRKVRFIFKVLVCVISFGFIFPNVMGD